MRWSLGTIHGSPWTMHRSLRAIHGGLGSIHWRLAVDWAASTWWTTVEWNNKQTSPKSLNPIPLYSLYRSLYGLDFRVRMCTMKEETLKWVLIKKKTLPNNTESHPINRDGLYTAVKFNTCSCFCSIFHYTNITCKQTMKQMTNLFTPTFSFPCTGDISRHAMKDR